MRSTRFNILVSISLMLFLHSCVLSRRLKDISYTRYITNHEHFIKESATLAMTVYAEQKIKGFKIKDIKDKDLRKKMAFLGDEVSIIFEDGGPYEIRDSIITFESSKTFSGITEIIVDFASKERQFANKGSTKEKYYFIKVTDRIYYRRRPIPIM